MVVNDMRPEFSRYRMNYPIPVSNDATDSEDAFNTMAPFVSRRSQ